MFHGFSEEKSRTSELLYIYFFAVTHAKMVGAKKIVCASTGNTSASAGMFAANEGMNCDVYIPAGQIAPGKLSQAYQFGAQIVEIDGITFQIKRTLENGFIVKEIQFEAEGSMHTYYEKVKCLDLQKIKSYLRTVNFKIKHTFGDYQLEPFNQITSDRLILVLE